MGTHLSIKEWPLTALEQYAAIPIAFEVGDVFEVLSDGERITLKERRLDRPYIKDYDAIEGNNPRRWAERLGLSNRVVLMAESDGRLLGGALVLFDIPELEMSEGRTDVAVLWDIRVNPDVRRQGVGSALLHAAEAWAAAKGYRRLEIETQNINVPACKFYQRHGYELSSINSSAYAEALGEIEMIWTKNL